MEGFYKINQVLISNLVNLKLCIIVSILKSGYNKLLNSYIIKSKKVWKKEIRSQYVTN